MDGRQWRLLALALFLAAIASAVYGVSTGALRFALLVVIPVFYGSGLYALLPFGLLVAAFLAWSASTFADVRRAQHEWGAPGWSPREGAEREGERWERPAPPASPSAPRDERRARGKWGGVVLIGPIPVAFGNDRRLLAVLMGLAILLVLAVLAVSLVGRPG